MGDIQGVDLSGSRRLEELDELAVLGEDAKRNVVFIGCGLNLVIAHCLLF